MALKVATRKKKQPQLTIATTPTRRPTVRVTTPHVYDQVRELQRRSLATTDQGIRQDNRVRIRGLLDRGNANAIAVRNINKPRGLGENLSAIPLALADFNPVRSVGESGRFVGNAIKAIPTGFTRELGEQVKIASRPYADFGRTSTVHLDPSNIDNPAARYGAQFLTTLGQTANFVVTPGTATAGTFGSVANETIDEQIEKNHSQASAIFRAVPNAAIQAAVERVSNLLGVDQYGGKFTARLLKGAFLEGGEEGLQQITDNIANGRQWDQGVSQSARDGALFGALLQGTLDAGGRQNRRPPTNLERAVRADIVGPTVNLVRNLNQNQGGYIRIGRDGDTSQQTGPLFTGTQQGDAIRADGFKVGSEFEKNGQSFGAGVYLTGKKGRARQFTGMNGEILTVNIAPDAKIQEANVDEVVALGNADQIAEYYRSQGVDGIQVADDTVVFNPETLQIVDSQEIRIGDQNALQRGLDRLNEVLATNKKLLKDEGGFIAGPLVGDFSDGSGKAMSVERASLTTKQLGELFGRKPSVKQIYGDSFIKSTYKGKPVTTNAYIAEFDDVAAADNLGEVRNTEFGKDKAPRPEMDQILEPAENANIPLTPAGYTSKDDGGTLVLQDPNGTKVDIQGQFLNYFDRKYKSKIELFAVGDTRGGDTTKADQLAPVVVKSDGEWVGVIMPLKEGASGAPSYTELGQQEAIESEPVGGDQAGSLNPAAVVPSAAANRRLKTDAQADRFIKTLRQDPVVPTVQVRAQPEVTAELEAAQLVDDVKFELGQPGSRVDDIIGRYALLTKKPLEVARQDVARIAEDSGYDINNERPLRAAPDNTPLADLAPGPVTDTEIINGLNAATEKLKVNFDNNLTGPEHAFVLRENDFRRQYVYVDEGGNIRVKTEQAGPDGRWQEILESPAPIKSANDTTAMRLLNDTELRAEVDRAAQDGLTRQYIWTEDEGGLSSGIKTDGRKDPVTPGVLEYDPDKHYVEGGYVRRRADGEIVGNYVAVGPDGIQVQVGRQFVTLDLDFSKIQDGNGSILRLGRSEGANNQFNQAERFIDTVAKDAKTAEQLRNMIIYPTREAEANMKIEANALGEGIRGWRKALNSTVPRSARADMNRDAVYVIEPSRKQIEAFGQQGAKENNLASFRYSYGDQAADTLLQYEQWARAAYDSMLERVNLVRSHNGLDPIPRRQDYITHTQEIDGDISQVYQNLREGIMGEVEGAPTRGKLPARLAARTEQFKPIQKYNPFFKKRLGDEKPLNPFDPLARYGAVTLHNIHMTRPAAMVRSLETALRAADTYLDNRPQGLNGPEADRYDALEKRLAGDHSDTVEWLTEHANILSGKSSSLDRILLKSDGGRKALKALRWSQRQAGRANIIGNMSSVLAQTLNLPSTIGTNGAKNTAAGIARTLGDTKDNAAWRKSNFMVERYTDGSVLRNPTLLDRALKPLSIPLRTVEEAFVHIAWNSSYEAALAKGLKGDKAIRWADSRTSKVVTGRSIGDTAHVYNSTIANVPLQFTREQSEAWKNFTKDQTTIGRAETLAAVYLMNLAIDNLTGRDPLPDPIAAVLDTIRDWFDDESGSVAAKTGRTAQRAAALLGDTVPLVGSAANQLTQNQRKAIFGTDSDLGRYDGSFALTNIIGNLSNAGYALSKGNTTAAAQDVIATLPAGSQIRKTAQGAEALTRGYTANDSGDVQAVVGTDPLNVARGLLFGKNALREQQQYFDEGRKALSGDQSIYIRDLPKADRLEVYQGIQANREENRQSSAERAQRRADLAETGITIGAEAPGESDVRGSLKTRASQLRDDASILGKSLDDLIAENDLPEEISSYDKLAAHLSGNYEDFVDAYNLRPSRAREASGEFAGLVERDIAGDKISKAKQLYTGYPEIPDNIKDQFYEEAGISKSEIEYDIAASFNSDDKASFLASELASLPYEQRISKLTQYRKKSLSGDYLANPKTLGLLADAGIISESDADALSDLSFDDSGKISIRGGGGGGRRGRKINVASLVKGAQVNLSDFVTAQLDVQKSLVQGGAPKVRVNVPDIAGVAGGSSIASRPTPQVIHTSFS